VSSINKADLINDIYTEANYAVGMGFLFGIGIGLLHALIGFIFYLIAHLFNHYTKELGDIFFLISGIFFVVVPFLPFAGMFSYIQGRCPHCGEKISSMRPRKGKLREKECSSCKKTIIVKSKRFYPKYLRGQPRGINGE